MESRERDGGLELSIVLREALEPPDRCGELELMPEKPECFVKDWAMEVCIRNSSKTDGLRDQACGLRVRKDARVYIWNSWVATMEDFNSDMHELVMGELLKLRS